MHRIVLQIDGGDIRGIMPAYLLMKIEEHLQGSINPYLSLITGTSTGAVIGGVKASGVPAKTIYEFYINEVIKAFQNKKKRWYFPWTWLSSVYKRSLFVDLLRSQVGIKKLKESEVPFAATAYGLCKDESHFIKSWDTTDRNFTFYDVISWSALSAAYYFGSIPVPNYVWHYATPEGLQDLYTGEVFQDGGQGVNNCTLVYDLIEILSHGWDDDEIDILSLGCGCPSPDDSITPYKKAKHIGMIRQIWKYTGQARRESTPVQVGAGRYVASKCKNIHFHRLDCTLPKDALNFGMIKYKDLLLAKAQKLSTHIPYEIFHK